LLPRNQRQELLSRAHILAVAACAGMSASVPSPDSGTDPTLHDIMTVGKRHIESGYKLDIQAKSTTLAHVDGVSIRYDLEAAAYESLRLTGLGCPRLLVLLVLPDDESLWLQQDGEAMTLRRACYWMSLCGMAPTTNRRSVRLAVPPSKPVHAGGLARSHGASQTRRAAMNPWRWVDPRVGEVRLDGVRRYLREHGWTEEPAGPALRFLHGEGGPSCLLPASEGAGDFASSLIYLLTTLSELEDRHPDAVLEDVLRMQGAAQSAGAA